MSSSTSAAATTQGLPPRPGIPNAHIGDVPHEILHRILFWKLLSNGDAAAIINFVTATPWLADRVSSVSGFNYRAACGVDLNNADWVFWRKFDQLRRAQRLNRL